MKNVLCGETPLRAGMAGKRMLLVTAYLQTSAYLATKVH